MLDRLLALGILREAGVLLPAFGVEGDIEPGFDPLISGHVSAAAKPAVRGVEIVADGCEALRLYGEQLEVRRGSNVAQARRDGPDAPEVEPKRGIGLVESPMAERIAIGLGDPMQDVVRAFGVWLSDVE
ncbi:MAG TPA: hypothetical protein VNY52_00110 [Solirubrobacteraceae bacterium]|nr:hypothetical protein [Solirubrobacteraceae bacterium]